MANIFMLMVVALGASFSLIYLLHYLPLHSTVFGLNFSPRLLFCKLLAPFDATMTFILVCGAWLGISTAALGLNLIVMNTLTAIGISIGVILTKKVLAPKWQNDYTKLIKAKEECKI